MIYPDNLQYIDSDTENAILSLLYQLTREEPGYKKTIGIDNHNVNKGKLKDDVICFVNCAA